MFESNNTPFTMPVMPANSGYGNNGAWGDDGAWWIIIFVLFFAFGGWGGNGWGGNGSNFLATYGREVFAVADELISGYMERMA